MEGVDEEEAESDWLLIDPQDGHTRAYYWNSETGETSWIDPDEEPDTDELPPGWMLVQGDDGQCYYFNTVTMETSWFPPAAADAPASRQRGWSSAVAYDPQAAAAAEAVAAAATSAAAGGAAAAGAAAAQAATSLPAGWEEVHSPQGTYYYNRGTGESSWSVEHVMAGDPAYDSRERVRSLTTTGAAPNTWIELTDEHSRKTYFYNTVSGETSWEQPASMAQTSMKTAMAGMGALAAQAAAATASRRRTTLLVASPSQRRMAGRKSAANAKPPAQTLAELKKSTSMGVQQRLVLLGAAFEAVDRDGSGEISVVEFTAAMRRLKKANSSRNDIQGSVLGLFQKIDADDSGSLTRDEFVLGFASELASDSLPNWLSELAMSKAAAEKGAAPGALGSLAEEGEEEGAPGAEEAAAAAAEAAAAEEKARAASCAAKARAESLDARTAEEASAKAAAHAAAADAEAVEVEARQRAASLATRAEARQKAERQNRLVLLYAAFANMDHDGDGEISVMEFTQSMQKLPSHTSSMMEELQMFAQLDTDHSGSLSQDEFVAGYGDGLASGALPTWLHEMASAAVGTKIKRESTTAKEAAAAAAAASAEFKAAAQQQAQKEAVALQAQADAAAATAAAATAAAMQAEAEASQAVAVAAVSAAAPTTTTAEAAPAAAPAAAAAAATATPVGGVTSVCPDGHQWQHVAGTEGQPDYYWNHTAQVAAWEPPDHMVAAIAAWKMKAKAHAPTAAAATAAAAPAVPAAAAFIAAGAAAAAAPAPAALQAAADAAAATAAAATAAALHAEAEAATAAAAAAAAAPAPADDTPALPTFQSAIKRGSVNAREAAALDQESRRRQSLAKAQAGDNPFSKANYEPTLKLPPSSLSKRGVFAKTGQASSRRGGPASSFKMSTRNLACIPSAQNVHAPAAPPPPPPPPPPPHGSMGIVLASSALDKVKIYNRELLVDFYMDVDPSKLGHIDHIMALGVDALRRALYKKYNENPPFVEHIDEIPAVKPVRDKGAKKIKKKKKRGFFGKKEKIKSFHVPETAAERWAKVSGNTPPHEDEWLPPAPKYREAVDDQHEVLLSQLTQGVLSDAEYNERSRALLGDDTFAETGGLPTGWQAMSGNRPKLGLEKVAQAIDSGTFT